MHSQSLAKCVKCAEEGCTNAGEAGLFIGHWLLPNNAMKHNHAYIYNMLVTVQRKNAEKEVQLVIELDVGSRQTMP